MKNPLAAIAVTLTFGTQAFAQTWATNDLPSENWNSVYSSADGTKLAAVGLPGLIYISTNSGAAWIQAEATNADWPYPEDWQAVAGSADGTKLVVVGQYDSDSACPIFTSTNSGLNWTASPYLEVHWTSVASSADGTKLVAGADGDFIYTSTDSGVTWVPTQTLQGRWSSVASSADGTKLAASLYEIPGDSYGAIYASTDSGANWVQITNLPPNLWTSVSSSADGTKLVAASFAWIYNSTNSGTTWTSNLVQGADWPVVASSADGTKLIAGLGWIYGSTNSGLNWTQTSAPSWSGWTVASSADGTRLVAGAKGGLVYILSSIPTPQMSITPASNSFILSWIIPSTNFVLQQNFDLTATNWTPVTNTPALNLTNLQNQVIISPTTSSGFYRLQAQ